MTTLPAEGDQRKQGYEEDLASEVALFPECLRSRNPSVLIDYLAAIFKEEDFLSSQGLGEEECSEDDGTSNLFSAAFNEELVEEEEKAELTFMNDATCKAKAELALLDRTSMPCIDKWSCLGRSSMSGDPDLVACNACNNTVLASCFTMHTRHCLGKSQVPSPAPSHTSSLPASSSGRASSVVKATKQTTNSRQGRQGVPIGRSNLSNCSGSVPSHKKRSAIPAPECTWPLEPPWPVEVPRCVGGQLSNTATGTDTSILAFPVRNSRTRRPKKVRKIMAAELPWNQPHIHPTSAELPSQRDNMQALGVFAQPQRLPSQLTSVRHVICSVGQMNSPQQKAWPNSQSAGRHIQQPSSSTLHLGSDTNRGLQNFGGSKLVMGQIAMPGAHIPQLQDGEQGTLDHAPIMSEHQVVPRAVPLHMERRTNRAAHIQQGVHQPQSTLLLQPSKPESIQSMMQGLAGRERPTLKMSDFVYPVKSERLDLSQPSPRQQQPTGSTGQQDQYLRPQLRLGGMSGQGLGRTQQQMMLQSGSFAGQHIQPASNQLRHNFAHQSLVNAMQHPGPAASNPQSVRPELSVPYSARPAPGGPLRQYGVHYGPLPSHTAAILQAPRPGSHGQPSSAHFHPEQSGLSKPAFHSLPVNGSDMATAHTPPSYAQQPHAVKESRPGCPPDLWQQQQQQQLGRQAAQKHPSVINREQVDNLVHSMPVNGVLEDEWRLGLPNRQQQYRSNSKSQVLPQVFMKELGEFGPPSKRMGDLNTITRRLPSSAAEQKTSP